MSARLLALLRRIPVTRQARPTPTRLAVVHAYGASGTVHELAVPRGACPVSGNPLSGTLRVEYTATVSVEVVTLHEYAEPGAGRFKITAATPEKWRTRASTRAGSARGTTGTTSALRRGARLATPAHPAKDAAPPPVTRDSMDVPLCGACFDALPVVGGAP